MRHPEEPAFLPAGRGISRGTSIVVLEIPSEIQNEPTPDPAVAQSDSESRKASSRRARVLTSGPRDLPWHIASYWRYRQKFKMTYRRLDSVSSMILWQGTAFSRAV
jgi:hypothetical protein